MPRDAGCLADENMGYENSSRIELKRGHQWFLETGEPEIINNKKQAVEAVGGRPVSGVSHLDVSPWDTNFGFHSVTGQFSDRLFGSEPVRTFNLAGKNMPSIGSGNLNMGRKDFENNYGNDPSVGLSISHAIDDPSSCLNFGGVRKVKVNQVRDANNCMSASMGHSYSRADDSAISMVAGYGKNAGNISLGQTYNNVNENVVSAGTAMTKADDNLRSMGHAFNKGDGSFMLMGHSYGKGDESALSMGQPFDRGDGNFISIGQSYDKEDGNLISLGNSYNKGHDSFMSMGPTYSKSGENFISVAPSYDKGTDHIVSVGPTYDKVDSNLASTNSSYDKGVSNSLPMGHNFNKNEGCTISFGGFNDDPDPNPSAGIISGYDLLMGNQNSAHGLDGQKDLVESNSEPVVNSNPKSNSKTDNVLKSKEPKARRVPSNNFPSNVKSLLSTGIFDGVPVKYVSWSREKHLKGVIKGTGYLCSCNECKESKALNAYEFERHAGAKTKHPNNHIYFENGKTIYAAVQELKNTPQEMLFDAIQTVTGSTINQKNFRVWKASYQAATRELQRIYGKDEVVIPT
ncbi:uncharacterized protein LOC114745421 [Neltuma alba]|uniref:uncharacterized protein LOC114717526 n=1 Tax=Neltuma alba TaxID=207710 RepID=UPI0010A40D02|nr:uncharacterized protein LOC114717526 [Prosopis alba]XP_028758519.1 uncharacterized protein LOC114717526 [Prosopis alba]XP_028758520.1 uncharacterized protein LOC114717526 [Prosopis alba]XP_028789408.1 uncharacterized protein LOC114745421 [Prosopis alba]XP_028789409.1 uncharacterized protein LOC114745421 [Prosopis alba]XP_028789410.1 uncharacterized protein LOC114745421 [Prosopis alba]